MVHCVVLRRLFLQCSLGGATGSAQIAVDTT